AARGHPGRRHGLRGREAGGGHLLHLPPARLRPAGARRGAAGPGRAVRDRPRRRGRPRRRDPRRQPGPQLPALRAQHGGHGPGRGGRVPHDAQPRLPPCRPGRGALPARHRPRRGGGPGPGHPAPRQGPAAPAWRGHRAARLRRHRARGRGGGRGAGAHGGQHALREAARPRAGARTGAQPRGLRDHRGQRGHGRRRLRRVRAAGRRRRAAAGPAPGPARRLPAPRQPRGPPGRGGHRRRRHPRRPAPPLARPGRPGGARQANRRRLNSPAPAAGRPPYTGRAGHAMPAGIAQGATLQEAATERERRARMNVFSSASARAALPRRIYRYRVLGMGLGAIAIASVLFELDAGPVRWALCAATGLLWPQLARWLAFRSRDPFAAEQRNLVLDSTIAAAWVPLMHFNLLPSVLLVALSAADKINTGIPGLLQRTVLPTLAVILAGGLATGFAFAPDSSTTVILASLPMLLIHSLVVGQARLQLVRKILYKNQELDRLGRTD